MIIQGWDEVACRRCGAQADQFCRAGVHPCYVRIADANEVTVPYHWRGDGGAVINCTRRIKTTPVGTR